VDAKGAAEEAAAVESEPVDSSEAPAPASGAKADDRQD
jgi:hypothetical protein